MSNSEKTGDQLNVLAMIRKYPGASAGALEWAMLGGRFQNGKPVATELGRVKPKTFAKAKKAGSRASELGQSVIKRRGARFALSDDPGREYGYWPVGASAEPVREPVIRVSAPPSERVPVAQGEAKTISAESMAAKIVDLGLDS